MFETLFQAEARRRAGRRRDAAAAGVAAGIVALSMYGIAQAGAPEPSRPAAADPPAAVRRSAADGERAGGSARPGRDAFAAGGGARTRSARSDARSSAAPRGAPVATPRPPMPAAGAARTDLALAPVDGRPSGVTIERLLPDAPLPAPPPAAAKSDGAASARGAASGASADPGAGAGDGPPTWRITTRAAGTHQLELVAVDVREGSRGVGGADTVARRVVGAVEVVVAPMGGAGADPATAWQRVARRRPAGWLAWVAACVACFVAGAAYGRRGRGAGDDSGVGPDGRIPYGSG